MNYIVFISARSKNTKEILDVSPLKQQFSSTNFCIFAHYLVQDNLQGFLPAIVAYFSHLNYVLQFSSKVGRSIVYERTIL